MRVRNKSHRIVGCLCLALALFVPLVRAVKEQPRSSEDEMFTLVHRSFIISTNKDRRKAVGGTKIERQLGKVKCWSDLDCPSDRFCRFSGRTGKDCGKERGVCRRFRDPSRCEKEKREDRCGCDAKAYLNKCYAFSAGVSLSSLPAESCMSAEPSAGPSITPVEPGAPEIVTGESSSFPSLSPSDYPTSAPSSVPSVVLSGTPSAGPSSVPSVVPSEERSQNPSSVPSVVPTEEPSHNPSFVPSVVHSNTPTMNPSSVPTGFPFGPDTTETPSLVPSTSLPSTTPSGPPVENPSTACLATTTASTSQVDSSDTILVRPRDRTPILAPITGFNWRGFDKPINWTARDAELPIYNNIDRNTHQYWNYFVDELLLSRVPVVMLHGRGCWDQMNGTVVLKTTLRGSGDMCPRILTQLVAAVRRNVGADQVLKFGMWDDTGMHPDAYKYLNKLNETVPIDLANEDNWTYFWDRNIKLWFDTIPRDWWYLIDGVRPVIASWILPDSFYSNQEGNASRLLDWIKAQFQSRYSVEPAFILDHTWLEKDKTILPGIHAYGKHDWFRPVSDEVRSVYSYAKYNDYTTGVVLPSFRNGGSPSRNCGASCREVTRRNGTTLELALAAGKDADFTLLEGWTNMVESAGFYRSLEWSYPTQYINIVRRYADPDPETLRFEAEGADRFWDSTPGNIGGQYRNEDLDIGELKSLAGWYVGWTVAGEWLEYQNVQLGSGTYRFTARVATNTDGQSVRLDLNGLDSVMLPCTGSGDRYTLVHLGEWTIERAGAYNLRIIFETGGTNLDWFFLKKKEP